MIHIESVTKRFGRRGSAAAVSDVSLTIPAGDSVALWGANGAGKTTLIRCALGLLPFEGRILIGGHDVLRDGKRARMLIGYVPQELGFYDDLRVSEAVRFFGRLKGLLLRKTDGILSDVGLEGHEHKRIRELSGGMKQRLALAIALLGDPPVLVLDEVTASLDACGRREFVALLAGLSGAGSRKDGGGGQGRTLLFASHRVEEVTTLARRVVTLESGRCTGEVEARRFLGGLTSSDERAVLHLTVHPDARDRAIDLLRLSGFSPTLNGVGLIVPVPGEQKAAPFRVLAEGRIAIDDFELLAGGGPSTPVHLSETAP